MLKSVLLLGLLCACVLPVAAQDPAVGRSISQFGLGASFGADTGLTKPGFGVSTWSFTFLDVNQPDGAYFSVLGGGYLSHSSGGVVIADGKFLIVGWRQLVVGPVSVDVSVAPVVGARFDKKVLLGSAYTAVGGSLGVYTTVADNVDLGFALEPVLNVARWGAPAAKNMSYVDAVFYVALKRFTETKQLPWR